MEDSLERRTRLIETQLQKWNGGRAKLWSYSASHGSLVIRITKPNVGGNLHIRCIDTLRISSPTVWDNCAIKVTHHEAGGFTLSDKAAGMEIDIGDLNAAENVKDG